MSTPPNMGTTTAAGMVAEAKSQIQNLTVDEVKAEMAQGDPLVVDLRETEELLTTGRIPGAVHVPRGMLEFRADPMSSYHNDTFLPSKRVILHCASGGRSALGAMTLQQLGYANVAHLDGGMTAWLESNGPVERP